MKKFSSGLKVSALLGLALSACVPARAQTHKPIPLDCGGWFSGFAVHSSGRLYGFGDVFGAWRSDDGGDTWSYLNRNLKPRPNLVANNVGADNFVQGIAVASGNADIVAFRSSANTLWTSSDGGANWTPALTDISGGLLRGSTPVMYYPGNDQELWVAGNRTGQTGGLWRSTNGGVQWSKVANSTFDGVTVNSIYVRPEFPSQVWVSAIGGLYVSTNGGSSFTKAWGDGIVVNGVTGNPRNGLPVTVKSVYRRGSDGIGYMLTDMGGFRVTATDWNNLATYTFTSKISSYGGFGPDGGGVLADSRGSGGEVFVSSRQNVRKISYDAGVNWSDYAMTLYLPPTPIWGAPSTSGSPPGETNQIVQDPNNTSRWFMTNGKAPVVSENTGADWTFVPNNGGLAAVMSWKVNFVRDNQNMALIPGADKGAFVVTDGGSSGAATYASNPSFDILMTAHEIMASDNGQTLVAAGVDQNVGKSMIVKSTNGGQSWVNLNLTSSGLPASYEGISRSAMTPGNPQDFLVLLGSNSQKSNNNPGMWRTTDGGVSFHQVTGLSGVTDTGSRNNVDQVYLEVDSVDTSRRYLTLKSGMYRSTNNGENWTPLATPFGGNNWVHGMAVDDETAGKIWVVGGTNGVKKSLNGGDSWTTVTGFTFAKAVDAVADRVAIWGMRTGDTWPKIYYSSNDGVDWIEASGDGHRYAFTREIAIDPWEAGKIWVSGISANVISGLPNTGPAPTPTPTPSPTPGNGTGLKGEYFSTNTFTPLVKSQTDATINFNWNSGSPKNTDGTTMSSMPTDNFSIRWTGQIQAMESGSYTISVIADDTAKVWLGDLTSTPIINQTAYNGGNPTSATISMSAGQKYDIKIDFTENSGGAMMQLKWTRPGGSSVIVPMSQLFPTLGTLVDATSESGGVITARGENLPNEGKAKAFDNSTSSKWLDYAAATWIQYQFANNASRIITRYTLTSGNDMPGRDPKNWTLQGSNDGTSFVTLDTQSNQSFASRNLTRTFDFGNSTAYKMYRLNITANTDGNGITQLSEMRLLGP